MENISRVKTIEIEPTAKEIAECFWGLDAEQQSEFFNHLAQVSDGRMPFQLQALTDTKQLTFDGRYMMRLMGDYSEPMGE